MTIWKVCVLQDPKSMALEKDQFLAKAPIQSQNDIWHALVSQRNAFENSFPSVVSFSPCVL